MKEFTMSKTNFEELNKYHNLLVNDRINVSSNLKSCIVENLKVIEDFFKNVKINVVDDKEFEDKYQLGDTIELDGEIFTLSLTGGINNISIFSEFGKRIYGTTK